MRRRRHSERSAFREQRSRVQAKSNSTQPGQEYLRGAKQSRMSCEEDNERGSRPAQM